MNNTATLRKGHFPGGTIGHFSGQRLGGWKYTTTCPGLATAGKRQLAFGLSLSVRAVSLCRFFKRLC